MTSTDSSRQSSWAWIRVVVRWATLLLCIAFLGRFLWRNRDELSRHLQFRPWEMVELLALGLAHYLLFAHRYVAVLESTCARKLRFRSIFRIMALARFLNTIVPQSGNVYRGVRLKAEEGVSYTEYLAATFSFAWLSIVLSFVVAALALVVVRPGVRIVGVSAALALAVAAALSLFAPLVVAHALERLPMKAQRWAWLMGKATEVLASYAGALRSRRFLLEFAATSVLLFVISSLGFVVAFRAVGVHSSLESAVLYYVLFQILGYVTITPANLGVLELGSGLLGAEVGLGMSAGIVVSALLRIVSTLTTFLVALPIGGVDLLRSRAQVTRRIGPTGQ